MSLHPVVRYVRRCAPLDDPDRRGSLLVSNATRVNVLAVLAEYANADGLHAYPSMETIAKEARLSARQVARALKSLEDTGFIVRGNQKLVSLARGFNAHHRPVVYDIPMTECQGDNPNCPHSLKTRGQKASDLLSTKATINISSTDKVRTKGTCTDDLETSQDRRPDPQPEVGTPAEPPPVVHSTAHQAAESHAAPVQKLTDREGVVRFSVDRNVYVWENSDNVNIWSEGEVERFDADVVVDWWLKYRRKAPDAIAIRSMRRAVSTCLNGPEALSVVEVERQLHELMLRGLDYGQVLQRRVECVGRPSQPKPTWRRSPKSASCWSPSERPDLYRKTHELPTSSTNWLPFGRCEEPVASPPVAALAPAEKLDIKAFISDLVDRFAVPELQW